MARCPLVSRSNADAYSCSKGSALLTLGLPGKENAMTFLQNEKQRLSLLFSVTNVSDFSRVVRMSWFECRGLNVVV